MTLAKKIATGYFWTFIGNWSIRLIGIGSMLILVRILSPTDFGLMAIATLVIGGFDILTNAGIQRYILLQANVDSQLLDSSWTLNLLLRTIMIVLIYNTAGFAGEYFNDTRLKEVLEFICITQFVTALRNIGMVLHIKDGNFKPQATLSVIAKISATATTIYFAYLLENYWCLVYGTLTHVIISVLGSYYFHPYRPSFNFKFHREQFIFSSKLMLRTTAGYIRSKLDIFLVGKGFGLEGTGKYSVAQEFAILPFAEIISPATMPIFSGLAQYKNNRKILFDKTFKYLTLVYLILIPSIVGVIITAKQICFLLLGQKWAGAEDIMRALALLMLPFSLQPILNNLYDYLGKPGITAIVDWLGIILICSTLFLSLNTVEEFAYIRSAIGVFIFLFMIVLARIVIKLPIKLMVRVLLVPCISSYAMFLGFDLLYINNELSPKGLALNVFFGAAVYALIAFFLIFSFFVEFKPGLEIP